MCQCRTRWKNQLDPSVNREAWADHELEILRSAQLRLGNKWAEIAKLMPPSPSGARRTDNQCKNIFYASMRKSWRKETKQIRKLAKKRGIAIPAPSLQSM